MTGCSSIGVLLTVASLVTGPTIMALTHKRLIREHRTISAMLNLYCRDHHDPMDGLCPECQSLLEYAEQRLERCVFQEHKPTCAHCPVHCYRAEYRERIREMMRYAGPRMLWRHPLLAVRHLLDGRREAPDLKAVAAGSKG